MKKVTDTAAPPAVQSDESEDLTRRTEAMKREKEYLREKDELDRLRAGAGKEPNLGFQVKGSVNLGDIDMQAQAREAREENERMRKEKEEEVNYLAEQNEKLKNENKDLIMSNAMKEMTATIAGAIKQIDAKIEAVKAGNSSTSVDAIAAQIEAVQRLFERLGAANKPAGPPAPSDPHVLLEIEKMRLDATREDKKFQLEMEKYRQAHELALAEFHEERAYKREELQMKRENWSMVANFPQQLGEGAARAWMDAQRGGEAAGAVSERPAAAEKPAQRAPAAKPAEQRTRQGGPPPGKKYEITAQEGEFGETGCPDCGNDVMVAPTTTVAECAQCGQKFSIVRVPKDQA